LTGTSAPDITISGNAMRHSRITWRLLRNGEPPICWPGTIPSRSTPPTMRLRKAVQGRAEGVCQKWIELTYADKSVPEDQRLFLERDLPDHTPFSEINASAGRTRSAFRRTQPASDQMGLQTTTPFRTSRATKPSFGAPASSHDQSRRGRRLPRFVPIPIPRWL